MVEHEVEGASALFLQQSWIIPAAPFISFLLILWLRTRLPRRGAEIAIPAVGLSLVWSLLAFWQRMDLDTEAELGFSWMELGGHDFHMGLLVDELSATLALLVSFLSFLIVVYSTGYMHEEGDSRPRYYAEITLFVSGMLFTVLADNYLLMFIGWEIMGLCSYLLIGYWFARPSAASAAKKAFLVTRLGDISLLLGMLILWGVFDTFSYREIFVRTDLIEANTGLLTLAAIFIFGGAVGKSAQFPLHIWLPDAMEGPTTVSALIHAATMVKAGVFLVARSFPLFVHVEDVFLLVAVLGGITAFMAATIAVVQVDIKRVLAYSTLSQLGYMFLALGAGGLLAAHHGDSIGYTAGLFHLVNHAFFKALLFLGAGSVILGMHHEQDLRKMGGLRRLMPVTSFTILLGCIAIAGIPPLSGFWSKDEVLAATLDASSVNGLFTVLWALGMTTALLTAFYMFRMWFLAFAGEPRSDAAHHAHESPRVMTVPLQILALFAVISGLFMFTPLAEMLTFNAHDFLAGAPEAHPHRPMELLVAILTAPMTWVSVALAVVGVWFAHRVYVRHRPHPDQLVAPLVAHDAHVLLSNLYYYDRFFMRTGQAIGMGMARALRWVETWIVDGLVRGAGYASMRGGGAARRTQTGYVTNYATAFLVGLTILVVLVGFGLLTGGA